MLPVAVAPTPGLASVYVNDVDVGTVATVKLPLSGHVVTGASVAVATSDATDCGAGVAGAANVETDWLLVIPDTVSVLLMPNAAGVSAVFVESNGVVDNGCPDAKQVPVQV